MSLRKEKLLGGERRKPTEMRKQLNENEKVVCLCCKTENKKKTLKRESNYNYREEISLSTEK